MKQFSSSVYRNTFSSVFVKSAFCFLFLGLAYRLFSSSLIQFSPVFVDNDDSPDGFDVADPLPEINDHLFAVAEPPQIVVEPPPQTNGSLFVNLDRDQDQHTSENNTGKCNLFIGDWIPDPDGPRYTNSTCHTIESPQNCMTNGRPDFDYVYWRWKPRGCDLPKFDPNKFLEIMRRKSMAFIGDSIMRNHVQSLLCMLSKVEKPVDIYHDESYKNRKWSFPSHHFTVSLLWSPFLTKATTFEDDNGVSTGLIQLHLDQLDPIWTNHYGDLDYAIISGGKWFLKSALYYHNTTLVGCHNCHQTYQNVTQLGFHYAYGKALNSTLRFITNNNKKQSTLVFFRTTAPDHFENGEWNTGGTCNRTAPFRAGEIEINDTDEIMRRVEIEEFERAKAIGYANGVDLKLFDTTVMSLLRPDGHPGVYRQFHPYVGKGEKVQNDCLHWCLPGPIDAWNDLMMEILLLKE